MLVLKALFWGSAGALAWTHAGYPLAAAALARVRPKAVRKGDMTPSVTLIVPAHDEEDVIAGRLENLLELDYPREQLEIVVASDASADRTDEIVEELAAREPRVRLRRWPRGGKLPALNKTVAEAESEVVAFTDANTTWAPDALRKLVSNFADDDVAYVCGRLPLRGWAEPRGRLLALRALAPRERVEARLDHRRQRLDLRDPPLRLLRAALRA